jgi:integrase
VARHLHRLTATTVANLKTKGMHPDGGGLYLRVTVNGTKSWIFRYTSGRNTRDMGLGAFPTVTLAKARELAMECRRHRQDGRDPIQARLRERVAVKLEGLQATTFKACAEQFISSHEIGWRNAKHRQEWRRTLSTYVYPSFGDVTVGEVTTEHILSALQLIWSTKTETASRLRGRIEAVLAFAKARGMRTGENPAQWRGHLAQILPARARVKEVRHHLAIPYRELPDFIHRLRQSRSIIAARALEFLILTAARSGETQGARWDEVDFEQRMWTVPGERMKAAREHRVPLSDRAIAILKELAEIRQNDFVFPGMRQGRPIGIVAMPRQLRDIRDDITIHGFRSAFKDWSAECTNAPNFVSEAALAHVIADKVEAAYRRTDLFEKRRKLMDAWAAHCARASALADGVPLRRTKPLSAEVVPIKLGKP